MAQAVLFVELVPTTKGIQRKVEGDLGGAFDTTERRAKGFWGRIAGGAAVAAAAVGATIAGLAIKGGISRLLNIEDATAKLKGLGNSTESVTEIMNNALASVKGTAFGLDAAATIAASAVAAGIKPGKELEKYLRLTADAATIAGTSLDEMGSILNKVTTSGKVYTDNLNQLADRGIPIFQWLQDEYGVTSEELSKMVSEGKVDAETFRKVIEENIGGAALASGDTTRGAFANMLASLSRVGANLLSGVFPLFKETFQGITNLLGPVEDKAKILGDALSEKLVPALGKIKDAGQGIKSSLSGVFDTIAPALAPIAALAAGALAPLLSGLPVIGKFLPVISGPLGLIVGILGALIAVSPELRDALGGAFGEILGSVGDLFTQLQPVLSTLVPLFVGIAKSIGSLLADALTTVLPFLVDLIALAGDLLADALPLLVPVLLSVVGAVLELVSALLPLVSTILSALMPVFAALVPLVVGILDAILPLVGAIISALLPVLDALVPMSSALVVALTPLIGSFLQLLEPVLGLLPPLVDLVSAVLPLLLANLPYVIAAIETIVPVILSVVGVIVEYLIPIISSISDALGGLITFLTGVFSGDWEKAWTGLVDLFSGIWNTIVDVVAGTVNAVIDLINLLIEGVNDVGSSVGIEIGLIPNVNFDGIKLANGALVSAQGNGVIANIGEGRYDEAVLPLGGPQLEKIRAALQGPQSERFGGAFRDLILSNPDPQVVLQLFIQRFGAELGIL